MNILTCRDQSLPGHKLVYIYNGGFSNFELPLLVPNSTNVAQILCDLSYKVWSTLITKFGTIELFSLFFDLFAIIYQLPCCYVVTTSKIGLYRVFSISTLCFTCVRPLLISVGTNWERFQRKS